MKTQLRAVEGQSVREAVPSVSPLLNEKAAASIPEHGGFFTVPKFRRWRLEGKGPAFFKSGEGKKARVFYRRDILDKFIADSMVRTENN